MHLKARPKISDVTSISIECAECGHSRWRRQSELYRIGIKPDDCIEAMAKRLYCSSCRSEGLPGKNIVIQAAFLTQEGRRIADARAGFKSQTAREAG